MLRDAIYDLRAIFALREALASLDPVLPPRALVAWEATGTATATHRPAIGILAGSFDPLTEAHAALARAALDAGGLDAIYLALSRRTVDKEGVARPTQADRALVLRLYAQRHPRHGLLLFNRGLYSEQARAARAAWPAARALCFVVGFDKARQIFDPRYYDDRDAALGDLFGAVRLLVAPRGGEGEGELAVLLDRPENRPFAPYVRALPFDAVYNAAASTVVREGARAGISPDGLVPPESAAFLVEARPYQHVSDQRSAVSRAAVGGGGTDAIDAYALREALIVALGADRAWAEGHADLRALLKVALSRTGQGDRLRTWLHAPAHDRTPVSLYALIESGHLSAVGDRRRLKRNADASP